MRYFFAFRVRLFTGFRQRITAHVRSLDALCDRVGHAPVWTVASYCERSARRGA